jgi:hypothetical protein
MKFLGVQLFTVANDFIAGGERVGDNFHFELQIGVAF